MSIPTNVVDRLGLIAAVTERLAQLPAAAQALDSSTTTTVHLSKPVDVPLLDTDGHVQRYCVLHPFSGNPTAEQDLADRSVDLRWGLQLTVAAAFPLDSWALAGDADALLYRWVPQVDGLVCGPLKPPEGYDPGPLRVDRDVKPTRFWLPLQYQTTVTAIG